jgi:hypothetical protein
MADVRVPTKLQRANLDNNVIGAPRHDHPHKTVLFHDPEEAMLRPSRLKH